MPFYLIGEGETHTGTAYGASFALNGTTDAIEWIVSVPEAATITHCGFRYNSRTGTPPTYRISIQGVGSDGNPDGTVKGGGSPASGTFTPPADTTWNATWQWVALSNSYAAARGELIAIVIDYSSGTVDGSNYSTINTTFTGSRGLDYAIHNDATARTRQQVSPVFGYKSASKVYGKVITTINVTAVNSNSATDEVGVAFSIPSSILSHYRVVGARLQAKWTTVGKTAVMSLYNGTTALQTVTIDSDVISTAAVATRTTVYFDEANPARLSADVTYRLAVAPQETDTNYTPTILQVTTAADLAWAPWYPNWYGTGRADGGAWTDTRTNYPCIDLILDSMTAPKRLRTRPRL